MRSKVKAFLKELDAALSDLGGRSTDTREIVTDSTAFLIQLTVKDAQLTLVPDAPTEPPLQQAAYYLHSTVSGCSNFVEADVERHDF
jgi:hypothetical protein